MMNLRETLHVSTRSDLRADGHSRREIDTMVASGSLRRLGPVWLGTEETPPPVAAALRLGAKLTCINALRIHGVWVLRDEGVHLATLRGAGVGTGANTTQIRLHHYVHSWPDDEPILPVELALQHAARCQGPEAAAIALESALERRLIDQGAANDILQGIPQKLRRDIGPIYPRSGSGTETRVRRYLQHLGVKVVPQWQATRDIRTDLRVGDRLVIECDSREHHTEEESYLRDRSRDQVLMGMGMIVLRLTWEDVVLHWERTKKLLRRLIRDGVHRRPRTARA